MYAEPDPTDHPGYTAVEMVLIRLNTSFTPSGRFPVYSEKSLPDVNGTETRIGYDAAVCLQKYEPWIVETYNTSIVSPSTLRIIEKASNSSLPSGKIQGDPITNGTRYLNTTNKDVAFWVAHSNGINQIWKDNDRGSSYVPSPTVGPAVPPPTTLLTLNRLFLSPKALDRGGTSNSPQSGSPSSAHGSARLILCHTLRGRDAS